MSHSAWPQPSAAVPTSGASVFLRDSGTTLRTWSGYGPVIYVLCETDILLDLTPLGRQHEDVQLLHHGKYPEGSHDQQPE